MKRRRIISAFHYNSHHYMHICEIQTTFLLLLRVNTFYFYFGKYFSVSSDVDGPISFGFEISHGWLETMRGWKRENGLVERVKWAAYVDKLGDSVFTHHLLLNHSYCRNCSEPRVLMVVAGSCPRVSRHRFRLCSVL